MELLKPFCFTKWGEIFGIAQRFKTRSDLSVHMVSWPSLQGMLAVLWSWSCFLGKQSYLTIFAWCTHDEDTPKTKRDFLRELTWIGTGLFQDETPCKEAGCVYESNILGYPLFGKYAMKFWTPYCSLRRVKISWHQRRSGTATYA